jgi:hypothetical protein
VELRVREEIAVELRRLGLLMVVALLPFLLGATRYGSLAAWQGAVGPGEVEDFESFDEIRLPVDGGAIDFGAFAVENDDQGNNEWTGLSGLWNGPDFDGEIPDSMHLIISTEPFGDPGEAGPTFIDAVFDAPIIAFALVFSWCEDLDPDECSFEGFLLDAPTTRVSLWEPLFCEHSWCAIDEIRWVPASVPEPATGGLVALGLAALALRRRR